MPAAIIRAAKRPTAMARIWEFGDFVGRLMFSRALSLAVLGPEKSELLIFLRRRFGKVFFNQYMSKIC